eukprot:TRINITY_DN5514_c0_g1_i1.p1 TRINITY_DN5514_c0_g1~~TRINITY_DN5514_c0_g1_i1.p1  ORF type:complete len:359 (-),score=84.96 TRINITY_DN5514_c0_g1_i1:62-1138(-)
MATSGNIGATSTQPKVLRVVEVKEFQRIWKDRGTGTESDLTLFRPLAPTGYYILGDIARPYHSDDYPRKEKETDAKAFSTTTAHGMYCQDHTPVLAVNEINSDFPEYLRKPVDYQFLWNDTRTGALQPVTIWKPLAPPGFVALGFVATPDHTKPSLDLIRCLHHSITLPGSILGMVWQDRGSGGKFDCSLWAVGADKSDPYAKSPGTIIGTSGYQKPNVKVYVIDGRTIIKDDNEANAVKKSKSSSRSGTRSKSRDSSNGDSNKCPKCGGLGGIGVFGPCEPSSIHYIESCPTCEGSALVERNLVKCEKCKGAGGFGFFGKCEKTSLHYKPCTNCNGSCYYQAKSAESTYKEEKEAGI